MTDEANLYDDVMYEVPGAVLRELRTLRELRGLVRNVFNGKSIDWDANGWAEVTMAEDEVRMLQEAVRVR